MLSFYSRSLQKSVHKARYLKLKTNHLASNQILERSVISPKQLRFVSSTGSHNKAVPLAKLSESFLNGTSSEYVEQMYDAWKRDPSSVHVSWRAFFENVESELPPGKAFTPPPIMQQSTTFAYQPSPEPAISTQSTKETMAVSRLIESYRREGHKIADLDPLHLQAKQSVECLDYTEYGFTEADLDREFYVAGELEGPSFQKLSDIVKRLKASYCTTIGIQYRHIQNVEQVEWIRKKFESEERYTFLNQEERKNGLDRLAWAEKFENFLMKKYGQDKRFGLDGSESLIPGMKTLIDTAADLGVESIVMGMPHRGRLNVLANVVRKPLQAIFKEFSKLTPEELKSKSFDFSFHSGDVKYHLGTSYDRPTRSGKKIHLALMSNPSHLEAVDPLVEGKARAKQQYMRDTKRKKVMTLQLHGDAAFSGQGVVYETLQMSGVPNYTTGGVVHIVVNNQIGFTTDVSSGRSTPYCTDIGKAFDIPIFHVNADDPEAFMYVCRIAAEWRQTFGKDCIIDLICYRRYGHNELDEPKFTQPIMYKAINNHHSILSLYKKRLLESKALTQEEIEEIERNIDNTLERAFSESSSYQEKKHEWLESRWVGFKSPGQRARIKPTSVSLDVLKKVGQAISNYPETFKPHTAIARDMKKKRQMFETGEGVDWATGEALAFGTLLLEGSHVRLSGQDVERGTFSHRHAVIHDQDNGESYVPLNNIDPKQAVFLPSNSILSEFGVMGFELGYSLEDPNALILWEAQFGDFCNGAQVIIDQFLSCGEHKWHRQSGLVLLLPHGYDGQGPEHSSARLERFLTLSDSDPDLFPVLKEDKQKQVHDSNFVVANVTTPANYFHILRRQLHREFRKPLVIMSPKNLLRHPLCKSKLSEFSENSEFQEVIPEQFLDPKKCKKLVFCTGKVYYDILEERQKRGVEDLALVRIEQLAPFPFELVKQQFEMYPKDIQVLWCQEEHKNMGAWSFIRDHMHTALGGLDVSYVGRRVSASPAAGTYSQHLWEKMIFMNELFS